MAQAATRQHSARKPIGSTFVSVSADGHHRRYTVIGHYEDGSPRVNGFDSVHVASCPCRTSEDW